MGMERPSKKSKSVGILYCKDSFLEDNNNFRLAVEIKNINQKFLGPYDELHFNGKEAEIIVYVTSSNHGLYIQSLARARRLLIVITHGFFERLNLNIIHIMNEAMKKNVVKKISI